MNNEAQEHAENINYIFLRIKEVTKITGLTAGSIAYLQKKGRFPQCVKLGLRSTAIRSDELQQWMQTRERAELTSLPSDRLQK